MILLKFLISSGIYFSMYPLPLLLIMTLVMRILLLVWLTYWCHVAAVHPALSCAAASIFLQLYLKPALHASFPESLFHMFSGLPLSLWLLYVFGNAVIISCCGLKKLAGQEVAIFRQTSANFWQRRLWVLRILILPINFPEMGGFQLQLLHFWTKIFLQE